MKLAEMREISKTYPRTHRTSIISNLTGRKSLRSESTVLRNISLSIDEGEIIRLAGGNGSGKTTLLRVLAGILAPSSGTVTTAGLVTPILTPHSYFFDDLPIRQSAYFAGACFGMSRDQVSTALEKLPGILNVADKSLFLTPGQRTRLLVHLACCSPTKVLLLDEVLSLLDTPALEEAALALQQLQLQGSAVVLVAHNFAYPFVTREISISEGVVS